MPTHCPHPSILVAGLSDECARCAEIAAAPIANLDDEKLRRYVDLALARARGTGEIPHGEHEAIAVANVLTALERCGRIAEVAPDLLATYLTERWRLDATIRNPQAAAIEAMRERLGG